MKTNSMRRAIMGVAVLALVASPVLAAGPNPPGPPICGSVASLMNFQIAEDAVGAPGDNFISIPGVSPVNNNAADPLTNGFVQLCSAFGLTTSSSSVQQFNGEAGTIETYTCDQAVAPAWTPGQGAFLLTTEIAGTASGRISGVECARPYTAYADGPGAAGDNLYAVPLTVATDNPQTLCNMLNLRSIEGTCTGVTCTAGLIGNACTVDSDCNTIGDSLIDNDAVGGATNVHECGQTPVFSLTLGRSVLIQPTTQGVCDLGGTNQCVKGLVGQACGSHTACNTSPASGLIPGDATSTGTVTLY